MSEHVCLTWSSKRSFSSVQIFTHMKQEKKSCWCVLHPGRRLEFQSATHNVPWGQNYYEIASKSLQYSNLTNYFQNIPFLPMAHGHWQFLVLSKNRITCQNAQASNQMLLYMYIILPHCEKWWSRKITQKRNSICLQPYRLFYQKLLQDDSKYISAWE